MKASRFSVVAVLSMAWLLWLAVAAIRLPEYGAAAVWQYLLLPRFAAALMAGAALGLAGAVLQIVTRNPLLSPSVLGVTSGGQIGLLLSLLLPAAWRPLNVVAVLLGCAAGAALTFVIAGGWRAQPLRLVLAGTASNIFLAALTTLLLVLNEQHIAGLAVWQAGSLFHENAAAVWQTLPWLCVALVLVIRFAKPLSLLILGEEQADVLGVRVGATRRYALLAAVLLTAVAVTLAGPVAFVGLIAPHLARALGFRHPFALLQGSVVTGMAVVCAADAATQFFAAYGTVPLGLATALVGAPLLILLVLRQPSHPESAPEHSAPYRPAAYLPLLAAALLLPLLMYWGLKSGLPQDADGWQGWLRLGRKDGSVLFELSSTRVLLAALCGVLLSLGGWLMQQIMRNPLASPEMTGLTQGASLAVLACLLYFPNSGQWLQTAAALAGGGLVLGLLLWLNRHHDFRPSRLLICGLAFSGLLTAAATLLVLLFKVQAAQAVVWLSGSLYGQGWQNVRAFSPALWLLLPALACVRVLSVLRLGDEQAQVLGLPVAKVRLGVLSLAALATAVAVSFAGPVAFVGLLAPHLANQWVGQSRLGLSLLMSVVCGALLCVLADSIGRTAFAPVDVPLGLMTTLIGAPYLLALMAAKKSGRSA